jgi:hypothetical protein
MAVKKSLGIALLLMLTVVLIPATFSYADDCSCDCGCEPCCVLTQGFWKNHPDDWPVDSLYIGDVLYTKAQLIAFLKKPVKGNGMISLGHQLIAAKLNYEKCGRTICWLEGAFDNVDAWIKSKGGLISGYIPPSAASYWVTFFTMFNEGKFGGFPSCDAEDDGGDMAAPMSTPTAPSVFSFSILK